MHAPTHPPEHTDTHTPTRTQTHRHTHTRMHTQLGTCLKILKYKEIKSRRIIDAESLAQCTDFCKA